MSYVRTLQDAQVSGNGVELNPADSQNVVENAFFVEFSPGTSAGAVQLEESLRSGFSGTWSALGAPIAWAAANRVHVVRNTGVGLFLRARISTNIVGGTVTVKAVGR